MLKVIEAVEQLDTIFLKYGIKEARNLTAYRENFINYVKSLEGVKLADEYKKKEFFYEFMELQKAVGIDKDLLNEYTMVVAKSDRKLGQDFSPHSLSTLMSKCLLQEQKAYPVFYDAAGGTGTLLIKGYYEWRNKQKHFYDQFNALLEIDEFDIYNCYCCVFNFIIRGLNAIVRNTNTLTNEKYVVFIMTNEYTYNGKFSWYSDYKTITEEAMHEY